MKIILRLSNETRLGNLSKMVLDHVNNKITVKELKNRIYQKYKIKPNEQRLTYRICFKKLITLPDDYPLSFFYIKDNSMIFIEIISLNQKQVKPNSDSKNYKRSNTIKFKYMNKLGYFLPDAKTLQRINKFTIYQNHYFNNKKFNYSTKDVNRNNSDGSYNINNYSIINSDNESDSSLIFINDDFSKYEKSSDKKSSKFNITYEDNNAKIIKQLFSTNLVEKLSLLIMQNDLKNLKSFISQFSIELNTDLSNNKKLIYNGKRNRSSQANTNYKTSFNSGEYNNSICLNNNIFEALNKNGWNAIHYSSYYGYSEILDYILNKLNIKSNINILNNEGWTPLLLAVTKQHFKCVEILMAYDGIDVNYLGAMGTALHIACKKNNRKIASLLLYKADITIKDKNNKIAIEYTHDKTIIKLISKIAIKKLESLDKDTNTYQKFEEFINKYKHLLIFTKIERYENANKNNNDKYNNNKKYNFLKYLNYIPEKPPFLFGEVEKIGGIFNSIKKIFIEINIIKGSFSIFKTFEDYPEKASKIIDLNDIEQCFKEDAPQNNKNKYLFVIKYKENEEKEKESKNNDIKSNKNVKDNYKLISEKFLVHNLEICNNLVIVINNIILFHKYWNEVKNKFKEEKDDIINYLLKESFNKLKFNLDSNNFILVDDNGKEIKIDGKIFIPIKYNIKEIIKNIDSKISINSKCDKKIQNNNHEKINFKSFEILKLIGSGSFGKVYKVRLKSTNEIFAMKVLNKIYYLKEKLLRYAISECNILQKSNCPFIVKLHYAFQTPDNLYMILDYCSLGDLSKQIEDGLFEEDEAKFYIAELILAIEYLHKNNIIYRDLKPNNILIDSDGHIKLTDFGLAKENVNNDIPNKTMVGTLEYLTPEMISNKGSTKASDIYGIGVILYELLTGLTPFYSEDPNKMLEQIKTHKLEFHPFFSDELKDLLTKMLNKEPEKRIGIINDKSDLKNHEFFKDINWEDIALKKIKPPMDIVNDRELDNFNEKVIFNDIDYTNENYNIRRVQGFSFIKSE